MKYWPIAGFFLLNFDLLAQLKSLDVDPITVGTSGTVRFNNYGEAGMRSSAKIDYSDIRGSCFWNKDWLRAKIIVKSGKAFLVSKAKLNFYTNEIHFIDDKGKEMVVQNGVKGIVFYLLNDTTQAEDFKVLSGFSAKGKEIFVQVLVKGKIQLLKHTSVDVITKDTDLMLGRKDRKFESTETYYVEENGNVLKMKRISKPNLLALIKEENGDEDWLKEHKSKLKNEKEAIEFITYRNSLSK